MDITTGLLLLLVGIFAGGYGTIVGAGGGFILVPMLLMAFHMGPAVAAGSGLVIVFINSLSGIFGYARQKKINYKMGITLAIGAFPGSIIGAWLLKLYSSSYFYFIFATILVSLGIFLFVKNSQFSFKKEGARSNDPSTSRDEVAASKQVDDENRVAGSKWLIPLGFLMGVLSSYLGIGGGWLLVPILIYMFKVPTYHATATSIFSLCLYSSVGVVSHLFYGSIDWITVFWGGIGVIIGAQIGVFASRKIPGKVIVQMLSALLIVIGVKMYFS